MSDAVKPKGYVGIFTNDGGAVIATESDFDNFRPGGFKLAMAQEGRVRDALARAVIRAYCSPIVAEVIDAYHAREIMNDLINKKGCKATYIAVGYEDEQ